MRAAIAYIPDAYVELALCNEMWFYFVSLLAYLIHGMQAVERFMLRLFQTIVLFPFRRILHTFQNSDPTMAEYISATSAFSFGIWVIISKGQVLHSNLTMSVHWWIWANPAILIGLLQGIGISGSDRNTRAVNSFLAFMLWTSLTLISFRRLGFIALHPFTCTLMLACWLVIFIHINGGRDGSTHDSSIR